MLFCYLSYSSRWYSTPVSDGAGAAGPLRRVPALRPRMRFTTSLPFSWALRRAGTASVGPDPSSTALLSACPSARRPSLTTAIVKRTNSLDICWMGKHIWKMTCAARGPTAWTVWGKGWERPTTNTVWITEVSASALLYHCLFSVFQQINSENTCGQLRYLDLIAKRFKEFARLSQSSLG